MKRFILLFLSLFLCSFTYIRQGQTSYGSIIYNIDANYISEGSSSYGKIVYRINKK